MKGAADVKLEAKIAGVVLTRQPATPPSEWTGFVTILEQCNNQGLAVDSAEERFWHRILMEQSMDGMIVIDPDGRVLESNSSFARMLGYTPEEMLTLHVWDWDVRWTREELAEELHKFTSRDTTFETCHRRKDGSIYDVEVSVSRATWKGQTLLFCVHRDISWRRAAEKAARDHQAKIDSLFRAAPVGIAILIDRVFVEANATMCKMAGRSLEELIGQSTRLLYATEEDFDYVGREAYQQMRERDVGTVETKWRTREGEIIHVLTSVAPIANDDATDMIAFTALDITECKRSEVKLEKVHKQLVLASRQAGMAEVATSVLHNVGNVLNSVNVSATVLGEKIQKSKIEKVAQLASLLEAQIGDLPGYFANNATGRELPAYVRRLANRLSNEQKALAGEVELIRGNIEHIKEIVTMQQSYAKVFGLIEKVKPSDLIEDALRMNSGALVRHDVAVVRQYGPGVPDITVEKHKVLQILVNVIRNAKYACDESGRTDKRITLKLTFANNGVRIAVADNGVGIPPENLDRIFNHGFTTRKDGHGFGLHSAALAAKELGGSIVVESGGHLQGATFTLELPLQPPTQPAKS